MPRAYRPDQGRQVFPSSAACTRKRSSEGPHSPATIIPPLCYSIGLGLAAGNPIVSRSRHVREAEGGGVSGLGLVASRGATLPCSSSPAARHIAAPSPCREALASCANDDEDRWCWLCLLCLLCFQMPPTTRVYMLAVVAITFVELALGQVIDVAELSAMDWVRTIKVRYFPQGTPFPGGVTGCAALPLDASRALALEGAAPPCLS